jgi:hypothetical protein
VDNPAATIAAIARADELRGLGSHDESIGCEVDMPHFLEFTQ